MVNMAAEAKAGHGIFAIDETTKAYLRDRVRKSYRVFQSDGDAVYTEINERGNGLYHGSYPWKILSDESQPALYAGIDKAYRETTQFMDIYRC